MGHSDHVPAGGMKKTKPGLWGEGCSATGVLCVSPAKVVLCLLCWLSKSRVSFTAPAPFTAWRKDVLLLKKKSTDGFICNNYSILFLFSLLCCLQKLLDMPRVDKWPEWSRSTPH